MNERAAEINQRDGAITALSSTESSYREQTDKQTERLTMKYTEFYT